MEHREVISGVLLTVLIYNHVKVKLSTPQSEIYELTRRNYSSPRLLPLQTLHCTDRWTTKIKQTAWWIPLGCSVLYITIQVGTDHDTMLTAWNN